MGCGGFAATHRLYGFPLWGKLSPQVTDEGVICGHFPLIRRVPRHLPPKGEGFCVAITRTMRYTGQTARNGQDRSLQTCRKYPIITGYCNNKIYHPVGAGYAPPAIEWKRKTYGLVCRGGYYAARAAVPVMRYNGQTACMASPVGYYNKKSVRASGHTNSYLLTLNTNS